MARWTDTSEYPLVPSLESGDRLMLFREGVGQRQIAGANLPAGGGGGGGGGYDLAFYVESSAPSGAHDAILVGRDVLITGFRWNANVLPGEEIGIEFLVEEVPRGIGFTVAIATLDENGDFNYSFNSGQFIVPDGGTLHMFVDADDDLADLRITAVGESQEQGS